MNPIPIGALTLILNQEIPKRFQKTLKRCHRCNCVVLIWMVMNALYACGGAEIFERTIEPLLCSSNVLDTYALTKRSDTDDHTDQIGKDVASCKHILCFVLVWWNWKLLSVTIISLSFSLQHIIRPEVWPYSQHEDHCACGRPRSGQ